MYLSHRRFSSRTRTVRNALSVCCTVALITAASAAISADRPGSRSGWADGSRSIESRPGFSAVAGAPAQGEQYPDTETMLQMYHAARKDGRLDAGMSTEYPTLPILKAAYRLLNEPGAARNTPQGEALGKPIADPLFQTKAATCRSATRACLVKAASYGYEGNFSTTEWARLFTCSMAAAGRNQDSPKISTKCTDILDGSADCALANTLCGVVNEPTPAAATFIGTTSTGEYTKTCGNLTSGVPNDRIIKLTVESKLINSIRRITRLNFTCSSRASVWLGTNTGGAAEARNCMPSTNSTRAIEGVKGMKPTELGLHSLRLRCDDTYNSDPGGDIYGPVAASSTAGTSPTEKRSECPEGSYAWGIRYFVNTTSPLANQVITGFNFICRK